MALTWLFNSVPTAARAEEEAPAAPMELLAANEISKYIDYSSAVEHGHVGRVYAEEDMNTLVYLNQDGTKTAYFFDYDVKYEDADGNIKEKDIGLKTVDGGFGLKQSDITLKLPTDVLDGVEFTHNGNYIKLVPLVDNMQTSIGQLVTQPMDAVINTADNEVTYGRAFGAGVSLKYTPVINGVKEDIILNSYTDENTWSFLLTTNGMYPFTDEGGVYYFAKTANAANKYSLGRVYAYDSNGSEAYGTMDVTEVKPGAMYIVSLAVDDTFLQGAEYPVTVDPTISVPQGGISDAVLYSKYPTQNYGNDIAGYVGYSGVENGRNIGRALFRFDSLINSTAFGYISTVTSAQFILPMAVVTGTHTLSVHQCTLPNWSESTVTWNSASTYFNASAYSTVTAQANTNAVFNVTSAVNAWRNNANYRTGGLMLKSSNETANPAYFATSEKNLTGPTMVVTYNTDMSLHFKNSISLEINESVSIKKTSVYDDADITYSVRNASILTISQSGIIQPLKVGSTIIDITLASGSSSQTYSCTVAVENIPTFFKDLLSKSWITPQEIVDTDDGFYMVDVHLSTIFTRAGISNLYEDAAYNDSMPVTGYYDDWYIYGIFVSANTESISLTKVRESESDNFDSNEPSAAVSFVELNTTNLIQMMTSKTNADLYTIYTRLNEITNNTKLQHDTVLSGYFKDATKSGAYCIADKCIDVALTESYSSGRIYLSEKGGELIDGNSFIAGFLEELEYEDNNVAIYNFENHSISIRSVNNLLPEEKRAILLSHCGSKTFNHFAAEIQWHASEVEDTSQSPDLYESYLKADLGVEKGVNVLKQQLEYSYFAGYVTEQIQAHGEY